MDNEQNKPIKVFISYSWDSEKHKAWVKMLADRLTEEGIEVWLDQYQPIGTSLIAFMQNGLRNADKVLVIGTPNYKRKAEAHKGGTGIEGQIINIHVNRDFATTKFIPILRKGSHSTSFTDLVGDRLGFDFRDDKEFESEFKKLVDWLVGKRDSQKLQNLKSRSTKEKSRNSKKNYANIPWLIREDDNLIEGTYVGPLLNGKPNGEGQFISKIGIKYDGGFKDGKYHGRGIYVNKANEVFLGDFENGRFIRGKINSNGTVEYFRGDFTWRRTCRAHPEQYDVYYKHEYVAYVRLRFGVLSVNPIVMSRDGKVPDIKKVLYRYEYKNDEYKGRFDEWELEEHQDDIEKNILKEIKQ